MPTARGTRPPIEVLPSLGTGGGFRALADRRVDIALASRPLTEAERQGSVVRAFARTPLVFVANADVSAGGLDTDTLIAIYRGERKSWADGRRCRPILRPWGDAESAVLADSNPAVAEALRYALEHRGLLAPLTTQETLETIRETPGACRNPLDGDHGGTQRGCRGLIVNRWRSMHRTDHAGIEGAHNVLCGDGGLLAGTDWRADQGLLERPRDALPVAR